MTPEQAGDLVMQAVIEGLRREFPGAIVEAVEDDALADLAADATPPATLDDGHDLVGGEQA
jgi:hypothetical protein